MAESDITAPRAASMDDAGEALRSARAVADLLYILRLHQQAGVVADIEPATEIEALALVVNLTRTAYEGIFAAPQKGLA